MVSSRCKIETGAQHNTSFEGELGRGGGESEGRTEGIDHSRVGVVRAGQYERCSLACPMMVSGRYGLPDLSTTENQEPYIRS